jgi:hypothetical protein
MTLYKGPHSLFRALASKYRLNKAEYLQLYNLRPSTQVMLELVIEEVCLLSHLFIHYQLGCVVLRYVVFRLYGYLLTTR